MVDIRMFILQRHIHVFKACYKYKCRKKATKNKKKHNQKIMIALAALLAYKIQMHEITWFYHP